ncbi:hypothetical protein [Pseudomonas hormoni]
MTFERHAGSTLQRFWDNARLFINGQEFQEGEEFFLLRGQPNQVKVEVSADVAKQIRLELAEDDELDLVSSPGFGDWVEGEFAWAITPGDGASGRITLVLISKEVEVPWVLSCRVMSTNLLDEVDGVQVNGAPYPTQGVVLFRDEPQTVTLTYKPGSPVQDWPLELTATLLSGLQDGDLVVTLAGPHSWTIVASNNSGTFKLDLTGSDFTTGITLADSKVLSRNLADEATVQIDGKDAEPGALYFRGGVHTLTLVPKAGSPIAGYGVGLWLGRSPLVTSNPPAETFTGLHSWTITLASDRSGTFHFELAGHGFGRGNIKIDANKLLSPDLADEADVLIGGNIVPPEGIDFKHLQPQVLTLRYKTDSPLPGHPVKLKCRIVEGLEEGSLPSEPDYGEEQTTHRWTMTGLRGIGKFQLSLAGNNMTSELVVPVCHLSEGGVPDYFTVQFDGNSLKPGDKAHATRYGRHTITLIPKSGAPDNKVKLDWGIEAPDGVTMTPAPGVSQTVHPTEGATWELRCLGVDAEFSVKAEWEGASLTALETPVSLKAGTYNMRFTYLGIPMAYPPTEVLAPELIPGAGWGVQPSVQVTTQEGVPVAGVNVEFIAPDHPVGFGTTNATGGAGSSVAIKYYPKERHVIELLAKTTEATGRVSMIRLLLLLTPA